MTRALRTRLGALRRNLTLGRFALRRSVAAYVGWVGEGNTGDEAMFLAHRQLFPNLDFLGVPTSSSRNVARAVGSLPWVRCQAVCLGGGTLIGNGHFRRALESAVSAWPEAPRFTVGVGVEDPSYRVGRRRGIVEELEAWRSLLHDFVYVGVRGPLSQAALSELGIRAEVVGDPALALRPPTRAPVEGLLALNVGTVDDQWGLDPEGFRRQIKKLARGLLADGWQILFVPTFTPDIRFQQALADDLGDGVEVATRALGVHETMEQLARCELVIAHKLHAAVLAAAAGVPSIALEYRPKCRDFQESVGRGAYVMRTDQLEPEVIREWAHETACHRARHAAALTARVEMLRGRLSAAARQVALATQPLGGPAARLPAR